MNKSREQVEIEIEYLLGVIGQLQKSKSQQILAQHDCNIAQFSFLQLLAYAPQKATTVVELANVLKVNMSQATATRAVDAMIKSKLLSSNKNPKDKR